MPADLNGDIHSKGNKSYVLITIGRYVLISILAMYSPMLLIVEMALILHATYRFILWMHSDDVTYFGDVMFAMIIACGSVMISLWLTVQFHGNGRERFLPLAFYIFIYYVPTFMLSFLSIYVTLNCILTRSMETGNDRRIYARVENIEYLAYSPRQQMGYEFQ